MFPNGYNKKWNCNKEIRKEISEKIEMEEKIGMGDLIIEDKNFSLQKERNIENFTLPENKEVFKIPFSVEPDKLKRLAYNDCVYAWLLVHSFENKGEYHCYIYKNSFTFQQIAKDIHRSRQTVSRRFNELLRTEDNPFGFITEDIYCGEKVYKLPYSNPFQYLHGETVIKLLNLPLKDQKEELIKTLAYLLKKKKEKQLENANNFNITAKEIIEAFGHSAGHKQTYERIRLNLTVLQGAGIIKFKTVNYDNRENMPPHMYVYYVADEGKASDEWLGN